MQNIAFEQLRKIISPHRIISIIGESSTGKTALVLQLTANLIINSEYENGQAIWVQASEEFPKKRLLKMYQNHPKTLSYLLNQIYVIPKDKPFSTIASQSKFFRNFTNLVLPPGIKYIAIDNISHHHRLAQANNLDFHGKMKFMNNFFTQELFPLIMFCLREKLYLFLIHEVSYNPQLGQSRAYNYQLFDRVKGVEIHLSKTIGSTLKSMKISIEKVSKQYTYEISDQGLIIL